MTCIADDRLGDATILSSLIEDLYWVGDMSDFDDSIELLTRFRENDIQAADELFHKYVMRLTALVRARIAPKLARRIDPEDVVQSAYRSFFIGAKDGEFQLKRGGDLWRLLAAITINKLGKQIERHQALKRNMDVEQSTDSLAAGPALAAGQPTPADEVQMAEEIDLLMADLDDEQATMLTMRLAGYRIAEIATEVNRSERTVRRLLEKVKRRSEERLNGFSKNKTPE